MSIESRRCAVEGEDLLREFAERLAIRACSSKNIPVDHSPANRSLSASSASISIPDSDATIQKDSSSHRELADGAVSPQKSSSS